ncbi:DUF5522 domain-containing protein [Botrimarina hoheduenensis]|uniref:Uncharacterized protein n=1 Tax=Botrimarina hoheduenensis TaxID=2528000 RepID=A0A5C5W8T0_9BACT|nr:DUF5522 domain-containing protein [Botrimarina hoheduenensis]TWT46439.1 hypothetical protein Pla111_15350 [Botrimarina hoheduenensis]
MSSATGSTDEAPDYYVESGCVVFTAAFHLRRGYCCGSGCRHCPYGSGDPAAIAPDADSRGLRCVSAGRVRQDKL